MHATIQSPLNKTLESPILLFILRSLVSMTYYIVEIVKCALLQINYFSSNVYSTPAVICQPSVTSLQAIKCSLIAALLIVHQYLTKIP